MTPRRLQAKARLAALRLLLAGQDALPPTRELAQWLGVSQRRVLTYFKRLEASGFVMPLAYGRLRRVRAAPCAFCGGVCDRAGRWKFCSRECSRKDAQRLQDMRRRAQRLHPKCLTCGEDNGHGRHKFCSDNCSKAWRRAHRKPEKRKHRQRERVIVETKPVPVIKQHIPTMAPPLRGSVAAMIMGGMVCR